MPRCVAYHSLIFLGSLHLKKIPPMPVTLLVCTCVWEVFVVIVLTAKPKQKEEIMAANKSVFFFMRERFSIVDALKSNMLCAINKEIRMQAKALYLFQFNGLK
jgi:hypothetical protein